MNFYPDTKPTYKDRVTGSNCVKSSDSSFWVTVNGCQSTNLECSLEDFVSQRLLSGRFTARDITNISTRRLHELAWKLDGSDEYALENLRALAKNWEPELLPPFVSSHRRFVGPLIVFIKKLILPTLAALLRPTFLQQRHWNEQVVLSQLAKLRVD